MLISSVGLMARVKLKDVQVRNSQTGAPALFFMLHALVLFMAVMAAASLATGIVMMWYTAQTRSVSLGGHVPV